MVNNAIFLFVSRYLCDASFSDMTAITIYNQKKKKLNLNQVFKLIAQVLSQIFQKGEDII